MTTEVTVLRILHIVAGVIWIGAAVFVILIIEPIFSKAGPDVMRQIGPQFGKRTTIFMHTAGLITMGAGLTLIARTPGRSFDQLFTNGWGTAIGIGLVATVVGYLLGATGGLAMKKASDMGSELQGPPTPEAAALMAKLRGRFRTLNRASAVLALVAVGAMASARYA